jgi:hypothetical protein
MPHDGLINSRKTSLAMACCGHEDACASFSLRISFSFLPTCSEGETASDEGTHSESPLLAVAAREVKDLYFEQTEQLILLDAGVFFGSNRILPRLQLLQTIA